MIRRLLIILQMIKFEHTLFALPFAFLGALLAADGLPDWRTIFWIVVAMVGARSAAMAFNRLADLPFDERNPRTADRALPKRMVGTPFVLVFVIANSVLFVFAAWMLNPLAFLLSPAALLVILGYSYTKRFTSFSHLILGLSLAIAPVGGWVAVRGDIGVVPIYLAFAVLFWVAGFDIIYACQDADFDQRFGLYSIPARFGIRRGLAFSKLFHALMVLLLLLVVHSSGLSVLSWLGVFLVAAALLYEHCLVGPDNLSRVNTAFFTMNSLIGTTLLLFVGLDIWLLS